MSKTLACLIIASAVVLAVASVWNDSPVVDEIPHIGAGYSYVVQHSYQFNPEHPPLAKDLAGLGLLTLNLNQSAFNQHYQGNWPTDVNGEWNFGRALIFQTGNDAIALVHAAKLPMLLFFIISAWIIFIWTKKIYGSKAALLALFLFSFTPTIIAHARLVTTDIAALFGIMLSTYFFIRYLENRNAKNFWLAAITFGIGQLTKFSVFLLAPYLVVVALVWGYVNQHCLSAALRVGWKSILIIIAGFIFIVGPVYQLHLLNYSGEKQKADATVILNSYGNRLFADPVIWASDKPILRPFAQFGLGLLMINQRNIGGNQTYFLGQLYEKGVKSYFPIVYFLKEPLPFWGLVIIALLAIITQAKSLKFKVKSSREWIKNHFTELALLLWVLFYWAISIGANLNIGIRHLLPVYGFTYILVAGQITQVGQKLKAKSKKIFMTFGLLLLTLLGWYIYENLSVFPYYLTYFNEVALLRPPWIPASQAGYIPGGHNYVTDSNLDWGQDLKRLADWVDKNNVQKISLDYFGWADQSYYLDGKFVWIVNGQYDSVEKFFKDNPTGGYIAVSGTFYEQSQADPKHNYAWLNNYKPIALIGNSIFVWHIAP